MKLRNIYSLSLALLSATLSWAQVTTEPAKPEEIDPNGSLKITVDVSLLDNTKDYIQNLIDAVDNGEDLYIWTWNPAEHPAGHPLVNGTGERTWQNSNDSLKMTKEGPYLFSWTIVPTEFYEVDAQTVYANNIEFLVKPKNGGGWGDPDRKSDDFLVEVNPPSTERAPAHLFPGRFQQDDLVVLYYDNKEEENPNMQNLGTDECYFFAQATLSDSTVALIAPNSFQVGPNFPELRMNSAGDGIFKKYFVPRQFFNVPEGVDILDITLSVQKPGRLSRIDYDITANLSCD